MRTTIGFIAWVLVASVTGGCGFQTPALRAPRDSAAFRALALGPADADNALTDDTSPATWPDVSVAVFLGGRPRKSRVVVGLVDRSTMRFTVRAFDPTPASVILRVVTFHAVPAPGSEPLQAFAAALDPSDKVISYDSTPVSMERSARVDGAFASTQLALDDETATHN